jgi:hypothetical protein
VSRAAPSGRRGSSPPAEGSRARCATGPRCTTRSHKTHISECHEVLYRWHPWSGRSVFVLLKFVRGSEPVFRCRLSEDDATTPLEIPAWMFDRATCSRMRLTVTPRVACEHLVALRTLLRACGTATRTLQGLQDQHRPLNTTGDADATTPLLGGDSRSVPPAASSTDVDHDSAGGARQGHITARQARSDNDRTASRGRRRKEAGS